MSNLKLKPNGGSALAIADDLPAAGQIGSTRLWAGEYRRTKLTQPLDHGNRNSAAGERGALMKNADSDEYVYTKYITTRSGKRIYAWQYGLKAFCFKAKPKKK